jgi:membrane-bound lytic murein transglycosylase B
MPGRHRNHVAVAVGALVALAVVGAVLASVWDGGSRPASPTPAARTAAPRGPDGPLPKPDTPLPRTPGELAAALASSSTALDAAIDRWRTEGDPASGRPPSDVSLLASHQQRIYRLLGPHPALARATLDRLPRQLRRVARDNVLARRELSRITSIHRGPPPRIRLGAAEPADVLRRHYQAARRRFAVGPALLAAVNFVESAFGRMRNRSVSGARGPMQFIPATWRTYGLGGDINDPRDAILGAANYLHANGAPGHQRRALFSYNPSWAYVHAITRYARRIRADWRAFYAYYAWQVYVGDRRLTKPDGEGHTVP